MGLRAWLRDQFAPLPAPERQVTLAEFLEGGFKASTRGGGAGPVGLAFGDYLSRGSRMSDMSEYLGAYKIPSVKSAVNVIAQSYATAPLQFLDGADRVVDLPSEHPDLHRLLRQPNRDMDGPTFREHQAMDLSLCGNSFTVLDEFNGLGQPGALYRLPPHKARIVRDDAGDTWYGWLYDAAGRTSAAGRDLRIKWFPTWQVLHVKYAHPLDDLWGLGIIEAGEVTFSADKLIGEFKRSYFSRGAVLDGILKMDDSLSEDEYKAALNRWRALREGANTQLRTAILYNGMDYKPIQEPLGNVPIIELSRMSRNDVLQLFGVPPQKLGDFEGTNYRNAVEADHYFNAETMQPLLRRFTPGWTRLASFWSEALVAEFVGREVLDHKERAETAWRMAQTGAARRNELRVAMGLAPLDQNDPEGQVFICISPGLQVLDANAAEPESLLPLGADNPAARDLGEDAPAEDALARPAQPDAPSGTERPAAGTASARPARPAPNRAPVAGTGPSTAGVKSTPFYPAGLLTDEVRRQLRRTPPDTAPGPRLRVVRTDEDAPCA